MGSGKAGLSNTFFIIMKEVTLKGTLRKTGKKADVNSVRRGNNVPCVVYGNGVENTSFSVDEKELNVITNTPFSYIINLDIEGKVIPAILHQIQFHPVTDRALHADFLAVTNDKPISINVPVKVSGNSDGVKQGGKLLIYARKLRVSGMKANLPDELPVDVTTLKLGKEINAGDLSYDNISIISPKTTVICAVRMTRAAVADTDEGAAGEGAPATDTAAEAPAEDKK